MEGHLCILRDTSQAKASKWQDNKGRCNCSEDNEVSEIDALEVDGQIVERAQEGNTADKIHNNLTE